MAPYRAIQHRLSPDWYDAMLSRVIDAGQSGSHLSQGGCDGGDPDDLHPQLSNRRTFDSEDCSGRLGLKGYDQRDQDSTDGVVMTAVFHPYSSP